jgi:hypothetical protein
MPIRPLKDKLLILLPKLQQDPLGGFLGALFQAV